MPESSPFELSVFWVSLRISMGKPISSILVVISLIVLATSAIGEEVHLVLGGDDDAASILYEPHQVEEGPDGNLYILDWGDSYIKVYSPAGEFLRSIGGPGEGPGEFQRIDGATLGFTEDKELFFTEFIGGHHWITVLKLNGDLVRVVSPKISVTFGIEKAHPIEGGGYLLLLSYGAKARAQRNFFFYDEPRSLVEIDSTGAILSKLAQTNFTGLISSIPNGATTNLPYTPAFAWAPIGDNQVVWSDGLSPTLKVFGFSGELVQEIVTSLPQPQPVSKSDLKAWRAEREETISSRNPEWWYRFGVIIGEYKESLYDKPILRSITVTPLGNWLIEGSAYSDPGKSKFWLLDRRGTLLGTVSAAAWGARISESFLMFFAYGEDELPQVHIIGRSASDLETLKLLADT